LSSDAKIIAALLKKQPQTKESICKETKISDSSFYRNIPLLEKTKLIKQIDQIYALWDFDVLEERIEAALSKLIKENPILHFSHVVNEIGKPWHEGLGFTQAEIVKQLIEKCNCSERTVYNDFETRSIWQPILQSAIKSDDVLLKVVNRYEQIYRQASLRLLSSSNQYVQVGALHLMLRANSLLFETAVLPEMLGKLKALEEKAKKGVFVP